MCKYASVLCLCLALTLVLPAAVEQAGAQGAWQPSAQTGFGLGNDNVMATPFATYDGELYVGVSNGDGAEVRVYRGGAWVMVNDPGFGDPDNVAVTAMESYGGRLYAGTFNFNSGCEVWSYDGTGWEQEVGDMSGGMGNGFGDVANNGAVAMEVHDSRLYVGTLSFYINVFFQIVSDGSEIWSFDGGSWSQSMAGGFGDNRNMGVMSLKEYGGGLYAGTLCTEVTVGLVGSIADVTFNSKGCQLWREGSGGWDRIAGDGFGDIDNMAVSAMEVYGGGLYLGTFNGGASLSVDISDMSNPDITGTDWHSGGLCLYSCDGNTLTGVVQGGFPGIGGIGAFSMAAMAVGDKELLLVGSAREVTLPDGESSLSGVLMAYDGQNWDRAAADGFGNPFNKIITSLAVWGGSAYAGTFNIDVGCEVWYGTPALPNPASGSTSFYFAEGYTGDGFQEYLSLGNSGSSAVRATITYLFKDGGTQQQTVDIPPRSRTTVNVNAVVGPGMEVSAKIEASQPFIAERPMYFDYQGRWTGGHDTAGAVAPSRTWYFAEGYTGPGFEEWICVLNPGDATANLTFSFMTQEEGLKVVDSQVVAPHSRGSFKVNDLLDEDYYQTSLALASDAPVVAERPMYFDYVGRGVWHWEGGHCVMGTTTLSTEYFFAEGTTRAGFEQWLTLQNPGAAEITVNAVYHLGPGQGDPIPKSYTVPAATRSTVFVPDEVGRDKDVSVHLSSPSPFLAERPMYFHYTYTGFSAEGGHCVIGAPAAAYAWFMGEGYTGTGFDQWLCLQNPGDTDAVVEVTYYTQEEGALPPRQVPVPAHSRNTLMVNEHAGRGYQLSTGVRVLSGPAIIVERPMYFIFNGWDGGHDVVGFPD